jgi:hypothetical protein
LPLERP